MCTVRIQITVNGPNDVSNPGLEGTRPAAVVMPGLVAAHIVHIVLATAAASLDIQVITALATSSATSFWSTSGLRNNSAPPSDSNQEVRPSAPRMQLGAVQMGPRLTMGAATAVPALDYSSHVPV